MTGESIGLEGLDDMRKIFTFKNKRHIPKPLAWLLALFLKLYAKSFRVTLDDPEGRLRGDGGGAAVFVLWHNRILFLPALCPRRRLSAMNVLVSASRDGEYISTIVRFFGLNVVRGSSSRGGLHALLELDHKLKEGQGVVLTVDGPRGPRYTVHAGAPELALRNRLPLVPVTLNASRRWELKNWDGTQIPKPFAKVTLRIGRAFVPEEECACEELQARIARALHEIDGTSD